MKIGSGKDLAWEKLYISFFKLIAWSPGAVFFPIVTFNLLISVCEKIRNIYTFFFFLEMMMTD